MATEHIQYFLRTSSILFSSEFYFHIFLMCSSSAIWCSALVFPASHEVANKPHPGKQTGQMQSNKNIPGNVPEI